MGVIKDGKVSGFLPSEEAFAVHYPGYPSSMPRAVQTLGGTDAITKARSSESNKLELYFRPEDPHSHPASGELRLCNNLLLKISTKKADKPESAPQAETKAGSEETSLRNEPGSTSQDETQLCADIVARVPEAYHFEGMADYQHVVAVHADAVRRKKRNWAEMEEPHFEKAGLMDLDLEDVMILLPPLFSPKDMPENIVLRPPSANLKKKQDEAVENNFEMNIEQALNIDFYIKDIPKEINWKEYILRGSELWHWQLAVAELFEERPIWPKPSLTARLLDKGLKFNHQALKRLLLTVAYYFSGGPFLRFWIRKGYDPRKDPESRIYQRIDFRVPPQLRSYCDANASNKEKLRWEDLCKFNVFPYKCQISLQLYEIEDDYIQEVIKKPPEQTTCTYGTGWFLQHVHDTFRHRVMMRFLSVYPESGAKKLLKTASDDFEKSKRASLLKNVLKPTQEEQINKDIMGMGDAANENRDSVEDGDANNVEVDEQEEELDADEPLDLAGEDDEISLESHGYLDAERNSRNYLQELFDSFPSADADVDKIQHAQSSDEEYQIFEQGDDDETYPYDDFDIDDGDGDDEDE